MGKYNLGKSTTEIQNKITKNKIYINEAKADKIVNDISKQLTDIDKSLQKINHILNRSVSVGLVKGTRGNTFKSWAKKAKAQGNNALKLNESLISKYEKDVVDYPIKLLDERIAELERKIAIMSK